MEELQKERTYTYEEWASWDESIRCELVDGELVMMSQPTQAHQEILGELFGQLWQFLKGKPCKVIPAPFGVRLSDKEESVFEPDIVVVCDPAKLDGKVCNGAPDMIIEILSPSTSRHDKFVKFHKYQKAGVREYWIVDPDSKTVSVHLLKGGEYVVNAYADTDTAPVHVLDGCNIVLGDVFAG
ncbi:MAG: Uma2 family endonuclease [Oscillospiraceae bacterium]|nr:Uma2 family endonuclease [Oscillospiraceae bacterium]